MPEILPAENALPRPLLIGVLLLGAIAIAALGMWAHYGTRVFYEMIAAGIAACF